MANLISILVEAKDNASAALKSVSSEVQAFGDKSDEASGKSDRFGGALGRFGNILTTTAEAFVGYQLVDGVEKLATGFVTASGNLQQTNISFQSLIGNTQQANQLFGQLVQYANQTPFQAKDVEDAAKQLLAFGGTAQQVTGWVKQLGDVTAAGGGDLQALSLVTGQIFAQGKLRAQDMYQVINDGGAGLVKIMADSAGGMQKLTAEFDTGGIPAQQYFDAINKATANGGFAFQGADKQAQTFNGRLSTLKDSVTQFGEALLGVHTDPQLGLQVQSGGLFDRMSQGVGSVATELSKMIPAAQAASQNVLTGFRLVFDLFTGGDPTIKSSEESMAGFAKVLSGVRDAAIEAYNFLASLFGPSLRALADTVKTQLLPSIEALIRSMGPSFLPSLKAAAILIGGVLLGSLWLLVNVLNVTAKVLSDVIAPALTDVFKVGIEAVRDLIQWYKDFYNASISTWQAVNVAARDSLGAIEAVAHATWTAINTAARDSLGAMEAAFRAVASVATTIWHGIYDVVKVVFGVLEIPAKAYLAVMVYIFDVIRGAALVTWWAIYNTIVVPVMAAMSRAATDVSQAFVAAWQFIGRMAETVLGAIVTAVGAAAAAVVAAWNWISQVASAAWGSIYSNVVAPVFGAIGSAAHATGDVINSVWRSVSGTAASVWGDISGWVAQAWDSITGGAGKAAGSITNVFAGIGTGIKNGFKDALNWIVDKMNDLINDVNGSAGKLPGVPKIANIPKFAAGTSFAPGGIALVGEQGPELVSLPRGSKVATARQTASMTRGGSVTIQNLNVNNNMDVNAVIRKIGFKLATA